MIENIIFSIDATMPIFLMMVVGYILKKLKFLNDQNTACLNRLVFRIFLPALLFLDMEKSDLRTIWDGKMILLCFLITVVSIFISYLVSLLNKDKYDRGEIIQASFRSGAATLGIAFMLNIYDDATMVALMIVGSVPLYNVASVVILSLTSAENEKMKSKKDVLKKTVKETITNPIILSIFAGMIWSFCRLPNYVIMTKSLEYLGNMASPLALIALGATFEFSAAEQKKKQIFGITFMKLIFFCMLFLPLAISLGYRGDKLVAILIMLGSATTSSSFIMAKNLGHDGMITAGAVMITTLLSSFTLAFWLFLLKSFAFI